MSVLLGPGRSQRRTLYNDDWFRTDVRAREIAANILAYQSKEYGGWPKNVDTHSHSAQADGERSPADFRQRRHESMSCAFWLV